MPCRPLLGISLLAALLGGCATVVRPPQGVRDPVTVYLLDHGRTSSLVLPADDGGRRYAYGDWDWYALRRTGFLSGAKALLTPTQGALGREHLHAPAAAPSELAPATPRPLTSVHVENQYAIVVERERASQLRARLDAVVDGAPRQHDTPEVGLHFVPCRPPYTALHNSNHVTARWLSDLGASIRGPAAFSVWRVNPPR
jgi:hypothetical protein